MADKNNVEVNVFQDTPNINIDLKTDRICPIEISHRGGQRLSFWLTPEMAKSLIFQLSAVLEDNDRTQKGDEKNV